MPESKKRKKDNTVEVPQKHYNPQESKAGKILIAVLAISMVTGIIVAAIFLMIKALA